ncbi:hypothetical protein [Haloferula sp.]|uniref:hypothetical protein n=1 Tax=Haloferula sp. TaxID=2497595 RepID=UPI00329AD14C
MSSTLPDAATRLKLENFRARVIDAADLEERDGKRRTALLRVARTGREEHVRLLLESGADVTLIGDKENKWQLWSTELSAPKFAVGEALSPTDLRFIILLDLDY